MLNFLLTCDDDTFLAAVSLAIETDVAPSAFGYWSTEGETQPWLVLTFSDTYNMLRAKVVKERPEIGPRTFAVRAGHDYAAIDWLFASNRFIAERIGGSLVVGDNPFHHRDWPGHEDAILNAADQAFVDGIDSELLVAITPALMEFREAARQSRLVVA